MTLGHFYLSRKISAKFEKVLEDKLLQLRKKKETSISSKHQFICILVHCHFNISKNNQLAAVILKLVSESIMKSQLTDGKL